MSIELERNRIRPHVHKAWNEITREWARQGEHGPVLSVGLANVLIEVMWEVAATTADKGPEKGILAGIRMLQSWED